MKAAILAMTMIVLAVMSTSYSLPLGPAALEEALPVIPLGDKPQDIPASDIPRASSESKPEENKPLAEEAPAAELKPEVKETLPEEAELKPIEDKTSIVPSGIEEPKEVVAVVAAESTVAKEEQPALNIARSAEPEVAAKVDEPAAAEIDAEKHAVEAEATKGLISPSSESAIDEIAKPVEQETVALIGKDLLTESKSENIAIEKELPAEIPAAEIKEEKVVAEPLDSGKKVDEVIEAVAEIVKKDEEIPAEDKPKAIEVSEVVPSQSEQRNSGSEVVVGEAAEEKKEKELEKELVKEEKKLEETEESPKKEEEKKEEIEEPKKEVALEEVKKPIETTQELPKPEGLKEQQKKPEDLKESSEESAEDEESSQEKKDKEPLNKTEDDSSSEESDENKKTS